MRKPLAPFSVPTSVLAAKLPLEAVFLPNTT